MPARGLDQRRKVIQGGTIGLVPHPERSRQVRPSACIPDIMGSGSSSTSEQVTNAMIRGMLQGRSRPLSGGGRQKCRCWWRCLLKIGATQLDPRSACASAWHALTHEFTVDRGPGSIRVSSSERQPSTSMPRRSASDR